MSDEPDPAPDAEPASLADRLKAATARPLPKRFYTSADAARRDDGSYRILLDGRPVRTPLKRELALPGEALALAIVGEWQAQAERIDPETMPLTKFANTALDTVASLGTEVRAEIVRYAASDLLCYRAEAPEGLIERQRLSWDPVLAWAEHTFAVRFVRATGIVHVAQPAATLDRLAHHMARLDAFRVAALHVMATLTGSAVLALARLEGHLTTEQAWATAHVDEDWQIAKWGEDAEATARRARRWHEMAASGRLLELV